jgi:hypothetical protein
MTSRTSSSQKGEPRVRAMPAGVRKIPTAMASPATAAAADPNPSSRRRPLLGELDFATDSVIATMNLSEAESYCQLNSKRTTRALAP